MGTVCLRCCGLGGCGGGGGGIFSRIFLDTYPKFAACGGPISSLIVYTTAYFAQICPEQTSDFKRASKCAILPAVASNMHF